MTVAASTSQQRGGLARAAKLTSEERSDSARRAALVRWNKPLLSNPFWILVSHDKDGGRVFFTLDDDRDDKGKILSWEPEWTPHRHLAYRFKTVRDAACSLAQYGVGNTDEETEVYTRARIVVVTLRLKRGNR